MANGIYGTNRPSLITSDDIDIFYFYRPNRSENETNFTSFKKLDSKLLYTTTAVDETNANIGTLPGMYNLRLPLDKFGKAGIYTVYIKPKEIRTKIISVSTLSSFQNVRGIVLDINDLPDGKIGNNNELIGYRVEYFDDNGERLDICRLITSNNRCEPITQNIVNGYSTNVKYQLNNASNLTFCTLTPSSTMSFINTNNNTANGSPFIGSVGQTVALINTKFNPIVLDIEMTEHDIETLSMMLEGDQIRNLDKSIITTFNKDGGIYHQANYGTVIDAENGYHHSYKIQRENDIDDTEADKMDTIKFNLDS